MFEELRKKLKERYNLYLAKKYLKNRESSKDSSNGLSLDVMSEEVKLKILEERLTDDEELIYSLIMNLTSKEKRKEMIYEYVTKEHYPKPEELNKLPEGLRLDILEGRLQGYLASDMRDILDGLSDEGAIRLLESNKESLIKRLESENGKSFFDLDKYYYMRPENFLETVLYDRYKAIEDESLKARFEAIVTEKTLTDRIDDRILGVTGADYRVDDYILKYLDRVTSEDKKVEFLKKNSYDSRAFREIYSTISDENRKKVLESIFSKDNLKTYLNEKVKNRKNQNFGRFLREYLEFAEIDFEAAHTLFYVMEEYDTDRILIYNMISDEEKSKIVLDEKCFLGVSDRRTDLLFGIQDEDVLIKTIHEYSKMCAKEYNRSEKYKYLISKMDEEIKSKVVLHEIELEEVNKDLLILTLPDVNDRDVLKEVLSHNLTEERFKDPNQKGFGMLNVIIADKIITHDLAEELLQESDINNFSEENKFLLLLNVSKETREKVLSENPDLENIVNTINENEEVLTKLFDGIDLPQGKMLFAKKIRDEIRKSEYKERSYSLSEKFGILEKLQEKHASIGETIMFDFLEKDVLDALGGIDKVRNIVKYPDIQHAINGVDKDHLSVIKFVNDYVAENVSNADYIFTEILGEYFQKYESFGEVRRYAGAPGVYSAVAKYLETHSEISDEVKTNIFNIITNAKTYERMYRFIDFDYGMKPEDIENIEQIKGDFCDKVIRGEFSREDTDFSIKDAYLMKYYNLTYGEAREKVTEYMTFIEGLEDTTENLPLKKYIFALNNVLESNDDVLVIAYELSKKEEQIDRIEIEKIESGIKEKIAEELKETLYRPEDNKGIETKTTVILEDGKEHTIDVYEAKDDFNMLVTVLDAYGGGNGSYENYEKQWNTNKYARNQRICTTYIGNNSLKTVQRENCVIYGFTEFDDSALVKMAPYDIVSVNTNLVTESRRDALCMGPKELINTTRRYNELDIERTGKDGEKIQPSYIVCFARSLEEVNEESKKAAAQFGIPIVLIDREKVAEREVKKIDETLRRFTEEKDITLIDTIVEEFCNNKFTSNTTSRDLEVAKKEGKEDSVVHVDEKYFSDERLVEIFQTMIDVAIEEEKKGNVEKAYEIRDAIKQAIEKENSKHYLWQDKFGADYRFSPLNEEVFKVIRDQLYSTEEEKEVQTRREIYGRLKFITKINPEENSLELGKRNETFREDFYSLEEVQDKIETLSRDDFEFICDTSYRKNTVSNMYALLIGRDIGLDDRQIEMIVNVNSREQSDFKPVEGYTDRENEEIKMLKLIKDGYDHGFEVMLELIENPIEKQMKENEDLTNEVYRRCIEDGCIKSNGEELSLEEKIEALKEADPYKVYKVMDNYRMSCFEDEEKSDKISDMEHYFSLKNTSKMKAYEYIMGLPEEERKEFLTMAKVMFDAERLCWVADDERKIGINVELFSEGSKRYLPSAFQIQEGFANQRLEEVITKEGYGDEMEIFKERLAKKNEGKSPVEYAYELDRFVEKKYVEEKGDQGDAR